MGRWRRAYLTIGLARLRGARRAQPMVRLGGVLLGRGSVRATASITFAYANNGCRPRNINPPPLSMAMNNGATTELLLGGMTLVSPSASLTERLFGISRRRKDCPVKKPRLRRALAYLLTASLAINAIPASAVAEQIESTAQDVRGGLSLSPSSAMQLP